jgi:L-rhamnonate dehydratase
LVEAEMKIKEIRAFEVDLTPQPKTTPRSPSRAETIHMRQPIFRYPRFRDNPTNNPTRVWKHTACLVTAEDGTWGFGLSVQAGAAVKVINDIFAPSLVGENCMATEKLWDTMVRVSTAYGGMGLASYAISAVDCALWDLKGKILQRPVYELLGGPQKEKIL